MENDENDWQICELEDDTKSFTEFTVSAVPEIWIFEGNDGIMWCYWPKTNAARKIKTKARPEPNRFWMTYKCRLLMNAEKFSTYKQAVEAEKFCQNYSTLMDCSETENDGGVKEEDVCDSTMAFDVSWYMDEDDLEKNATEVGHDTFDFNKAVLAKAGPWYSKNETIQLNAKLPKFYCSDKTSEDDGDDENCLGHSKNVDDSSEEHVDPDSAVNLDYSQFKSVAGISNSTELEIADAIGKAHDSPEIEEFFSKISKIEMNVYSFVEDMQKHFHELTEIAQTIFEKPVLICEAVRLKSVLLSDNSLQIDDEQSKHDDVSNGIENASNNVEIAKACITREIPNEKIGTNVVNSTPVQTARDFIKLVEIVDNPIPPEIPNGNVQVQNVEIIDATDATGENVIRLPVFKIEHYNKNEEVLDEEDEEENLKTALIEHLVPVNDEDEAGYVLRTAGLLFSDDFFINNVKWRQLKDCAYMKSSSIMSCWKESHRKKFPEDIGNKRFIAHFRRIKSAKRAALKAKAKRELASKVKKFKN